MYNYIYFLPPPVHVGFWLRESYPYSVLPSRQFDVHILGAAHKRSWRVYGDIVDCAVKFPIPIARFPYRNYIGAYFPRHRVALSQEALL